MFVKILVAGKYNGSDLHAVDCKVGDVLETKDWYADKLIGLKVARHLTSVEDVKAEKSAEAKAPAEGAKAKAPAKKVPAKKEAPVGPVTKENVFLE